MAHTDGPHQARSIAAAVQRLLNREIERSSSDMSRASSLRPGPCPVEHTCEDDVQAMERTLQAMTRARQVMTRARRDLSHIMQTVDSSSLVQVLDSYSVPIPGTDPQNNTEEFDDDIMEMNEVPDYCFVAIIPSPQQHRLLSLLEQGLSVITPNNPNSASFPHYGIVPCSLPWFPPSETSLPGSQSWKISYEQS